MAPLAIGHIALLVFLVAGLSMSVRSGTAGEETGLQAWRPESSPPRFLPSSQTAFWDIGMLSNAVVNRNFELMGPLLARLDAGEPIHVVAMGTSITADFGGHYYSDVENFEEMVGSVKIFAARHEKGWLTEFMLIINQIWPHPQHILANVGQPGSCARFFAHDDCLEQYMPDRVDLVILETLTFLSPPACNIDDFEHLLARVHHHSGRMPAFILLDTLRVTEGDQEEQCIRETRRGPLQPGGLCDSRCGDSFTHNLTEYSFASPQGKYETELNSAADYYGLGTVSMRSFLMSLIRTGFPEKAGVGVCHILSYLFQDPIHPNLMSGSLLLTHLLTNFLAEAQAWLQRNGGSRRGSYSFPSRTLSHQGRLRRIAMRCYGDSWFKGLDADDASRGLHHEHSQRRPPAKTWNVDFNDGWEFVTYQMHGEVKKYKPGWVATRAKAVLQIRINSEFLGFPAERSAQVFLSYLQSYEHMGAASVACVFGCECNATEVNAHRADLKASVPEHVELSVTQSPTCVVAITVLRHSTSGEHKFKVMHVSVKMQEQSKGQVGAEQLQGPPAEWPPNPDQDKGLVEAGGGSTEGVDAFRAL